MPKSATLTVYDSSSLKTEKVRCDFYNIVTEYCDVTPLTKFVLGHISLSLIKEKSRSYGS